MVGDQQIGTYEFDVFVAYSRRNSRWVDKLVNDLKDHHISVFLDRIDLQVGEQARLKIEEAISKCRFFCLVISEASIQSYYIRRFELEPAFATMIESRKEAFVLPLLYERPTSPLPLMLKTLQYLDMSGKKYRKNLNKLVNRVKLPDARYTGEGLYKNIDTSMRGQIVGVGPLNKLAKIGSCVRMFFEDGKVKTIELYKDGTADGCKSVLYDEEDRVREIILFRDNMVVDSWRYEYDPKTGSRSRKLVVPPGGEPNHEIRYDQAGNRIGEGPIRS